jgi:hypothetical protein
MFVKLIRFIHHRLEQSVFLEITPPQSTEIASFSTSQLFNLILGLVSQRTWIDCILLRQSSCSFEIISRKNKGIQYILCVPKNIASSLEKNLRSYTPGIKIKQTADYLFGIKYNNRIKVIDFKLGEHFSLPINEQSDLKKHDPLAYLTGNMTRLKDNEMIAFQIILRPLNDLTQWQIRHEINSIKSAIHKNTYSDSLNNSGFNKIMHVVMKILESITRLIMIPLLFVAEFITGQEPIVTEKEKSKDNPQINKEREEMVKSKIKEPLFEATLRALLITDKDQMRARENGLMSSFMTFNISNGQSIKKKWNLPWQIIQKIKFNYFKTRFSGLPLYLNSSEVGALYHFPYKLNNDSSELIRVRSRELPAPLSIKSKGSEFDIIIGENHFGDEKVPIGLTLDQRQKHMYVIGKTGMGKTTLLTNAIYQDMLNGKGLAVFDPHGDMLEELLGIVPENRRKDVIVFDPSDRDFPIGLNLLSPGINFTNNDDKEEWITSSVIAVFNKITAKEYWGPRMEHILRNATLTALQMPNPSIFTLQRLLTDKSYQKRAAASLKDPVLTQFWSKDFALLGKMQLSSVTAPLTQRLGLFITTKMSRHILLQEKSTISMSEIMDEGKILLVNLSKGDLGEDQSFFFGTILTSIIWMAAYQRTKIHESKRKDFFLYVDEFQNFATPRFSEITSEGRKFHISLTASHQNIAQVDDMNILRVIAGNANSIICLKASPDDEKFILPFMEPEVEKGDIVNLPPYSFFMKVNNDKSENAFSGKTVPLDIEISDNVKNDIISYSRDHYATPRNEVEEYLEILFGIKPKIVKSKLSNNSSLKSHKIGI